MIFMKRVAAAILLIFFMLHLSGCPIMMPFMMGSMLKRGMDENMKPERGSAMYQLMHESRYSLGCQQRALRAYSCTQDGDLRGLHPL